MRRLLLLVASLILVASGYSVLLLRLLADTRKIANLEQTIPERLKKTASLQIGLFPDNMDQITDLIEHTDSKLVIICDYAGYGHYSAPVKFDRYADAIKRVAKKQQVFMYVYDKPAGMKAQTLQLGPNDSTDGSQAQNPDEPKLVKWMKARQISTPPRTVGELDNLLFEFQKQYQQEFKSAGVQLRPVSFTLPIYVWKNETEAVYSLYNLGNGPRELSFRTSDKLTLQMLDSIYEDVANNRVPDLSRGDNLTAGTSH